MKNLIIALTAAFSLSVFAQSFEGTPVLKGYKRTKIYLQGIETTCRVKVEKIKNLMLEDSNGNPAYNVRIDIALAGRNHELDRSIKFNQEFWVNNLFKVSGGTVVRDTEYASTYGAKMRIDNTGRILSVSFPSPFGNINCSF